MAKKKIKKVLIFGSNSFSAGSYINYILKKNFKVIGCSRSNLNKKHFLRFKSKNNNFIFFKLDINKDHNKIFRLIDKIKPEYIINFASQSMVQESWYNPVDWYRTNCLGTIRLYDKLSKLKFKNKLVHISTPEVYGSINKKTYENENYKPSTPYAASRASVDQFLHMILKNSKIDFSITRSTNVYGECQRIYRIIPKTIIKILKKEKIQLHGAGLSKRNFIHIDDVSAAIYKIMTKSKKGSTYHISSNKLISIVDLVKKICKIMNYNPNKLIVITKERTNKDKSYYLSNKKIVNELKWKPNISLEKGIARTINWINQNLNKFKKYDENYVHQK